MTVDSIFYLPPNMTTNHGDYEQGLQQILQER